MDQQFRLKRTAWFSSFRVFEGIALLAGVLAVAGCRLDNNTTGTTGPQGLIQFINAAPRYGSVSLNIDSTKVVVNQMYGTGSSIFVTALATARQLTVRDSANTAALATNTLVVANQTVYTVILTQHSVGGGLLILRDTVSAPPPNQVGLRIVNASPSAGTVDVYITGTDSTLGTPNSTNVAFENASTYVNVPTGGVVRLRVTAAGTKTVLLDVDASQLSPGQVRTVLIKDTVGGGLPVTWLSVPDRG